MGKILKNSIIGVVIALVMSVFGVNMSVSALSDEDAKGALIYNQVYFPEDYEVKRKLLNDIDDATERYRYTKIIDFWDDLNHNMEINLELPGNLQEGVHAFVTLGYQLNADGSMDKILIDRLNATLKAANDERYKESFILVAGGGTAANSDVTEADAMAEWLISKGVAESRILIENESMNTVQNAMNTFDIAYANEIDSITLISSPTHLRRAAVIYQAASLVKASELGLENSILINGNLSYRDLEYEVSLTKPNWHESFGTGRDVSNVLGVYQAYSKYQKGENSILLEPNGGVGRGVVLRTSLSNQLTIPSNDISSFQKDGKAFVGWGTSANSGVVYIPGQVVQLKPGTVLHAQWEDAIQKTHSLRNEDDLELLRKFPNDTFVLENDIHLTKTFMPIGVFNGVLDGQGYKLVNLNVGEMDNMEQTFRSMFIENFGTIKNLNIVNAKSVNDGQFGRQYLASILSIYNRGTITNIAIRNGEVQGGWQTGGIVVDNFGVLKDNIYEGTVFSSWESGAIAAINRDTGIVENNYVDASVTSVVQNSGIVVGYAFGGSTGYIRSNVVGGGSINATSVFGRITGRLRSSPVLEDNYVAESVLVNGSKYTGSANVQNGITISTEDVSELETYTDLSWDFDKIWFMNEDTKSPDLIEHYSNVTIKIIYVNESGDQILEPTYLSGKVGEQYEIEATSIDRYNMVSDLALLSGVFTHDLDSITLVYAQVESPVNTEKIDALLNEIVKLDKSLYSEETYNALMEYVEVVNEELSKASLDQKTVDSLFERLNELYENLELKQTDTTGITDPNNNDYGNDLPATGSGLSYITGFSSIVLIVTGAWLMIRNRKETSN